MKFTAVSRYVGACALIAALAASPLLLGEDSRQLLSIDHYVKVRSTVPSIVGQQAQIYVRERVEAGTVLRSANLENRVVLFVHGAGTPAEVAFDVPAEGYSWMAYLAQAGYDVFSVDMTGYGRSNRPPLMNDPCNLTAPQQATLVPGFLAAPCQPASNQQLTTIASDHNDINAAVDYIRNLRRVQRVDMVAWSLGGPRAGGYAAANPAKVRKLVLLAPAYNRATTTAPPAAVPAAGAPFNTQSGADFTANWDRQVGCPNQYERSVHDAVWSAMIESDPVGATWGPGVRRAPNTTNWGWSTEVVAKMQTPMLLVAAVHDRQVAAENVRNLFMDAGTKEKVLLDLGCASHNAMWESNRLLLYKASLEWLNSTSVNGAKEGTVKVGY